MTAPTARPRQTRAVPVYLLGTLVLVLGSGALLYARSTRGANQVALADGPKPVSVIQAEAAEYRALRRYVGAIEPWLEAKIGPQLTSAYVDTVLVRPGVKVERGEVVATLDCRKASAASGVVAMQARALEAQQKAAADEAARLSKLLTGGFVSANEAEQKTAETASKQAELLAARAQWSRAALEVDDCVLRAPFSGEVSERLADPGTFAHPGEPVAVVVDRSMVRVALDVPEKDFPLVAAGVPVSLRALSTGARVASKIARRAPAADPATRTIHVEIDLPNPDRTLPVRTTAEVTVDVGEPAPATRVPLACASVRGHRATLFSCDHGTAHKVVVDVLGERQGDLYLARSLTPGTEVVSEGRGTLKQGDRVVALPEPKAPAVAERASPSPR